jgi:hypothetical protein
MTRTFARYPRLNEAFKLAQPLPAVRDMAQARANLNRSLLPETPPGSTGFNAPAYRLAAVTARTLSAEQGSLAA